MPVHAAWEQRQVSLNLSRWVRPLGALLLVASLIGLGGCRDNGGELEREEGMKLRAALRADTPENADVNVAEYEYAEKAKLNLGILAAMASQPDKWPPPEKVRELIGPILQFEKRRRDIQRALTDMKLVTPLPVAVREDVRELLDERIGVDEGWRIQLESLIRAMELRDAPAVADQTNRLIELFHAYGPLQDSLKLAADNLEEQLRLPWTDDPQNRPGWRSGKPVIPDPALPSASK